MSAANDQILAVLSSIQDRLTAIEGKIACGGRATSGGASDDEIPDVVLEYDALLQEHIKPLVGIAGDDAELAELMTYYTTAMEESRRVLLAMHRAAKPSDEALIAFITPLAQVVEKVSNAPLKAKYVNLWKAMAEAVQCAQWPLQPGPHNYIATQIGSMEFYSNRARTQFSSVAPLVALIVAIRKGLNAMQDYCKENFKAGVPWTGTADLAKLPAEGSAEAQTAKPAPAPAPACTKSAPAPTKPAPKPVAKAGAKVLPPKSLTERGNRVIFTGYDGEPGVTTYECCKDYFLVISKCRNAAFELTGKVNAVRLDSCQNVTVVVDTVVASFEASNNQDCRVQVRERVPTFQIDSCFGIQVYLTKRAAAQDPHIVTAKSSSMMLAVLPDEQEGDDAEVVEYGLPEQFVNRLVNGKLESTPAESLD